MKCKKYIISKHALNRTIERLIKCQNIKLNKKQVKRNTKAAEKLIEHEIKNAFAYCYNEVENCTYYYTCLDENGKCNKYVLSDENVVVTVIVNLDLSNEIKKNKLIFINNNLSIKVEKYMLSEYIYMLINGVKVLFIVDINRRYIFSFKSLKGC